MWARTCFCPVCGLPFAAWNIEWDAIPTDPEEEDFHMHYDPAVLQKEDTKWLGAFRVLAERLKIPEDSQFLERNRIAYLSSKADSSADIVPSVPADMGDFAEMCFPPAYNDPYLIFEGEKRPSEYFLLPIHDACLKISERVCLSRRKTLTDFHNTVMKKREVDIKGEGSGVPPNYGYEGSIDWKHGCYGAGQFWGPSWNSEFGWEWICADPFKDCSEYLRSILSEVLKCSDDAALPSSTEEPAVNGSSSAKEISRLESLPDPALTYLTDILPLQDVFSLLRVSRTLYDRLPVMPKFWRDRLISGELAPWAWELQGENSPLLKEDLGKDWFSFAKKWHTLNASEEFTKLEEEPIALSNRRRIWMVASRIAPPMES